jgi:hypothetical protein
MTIAVRKKPPASGGKLRSGKRISEAVEAPPSFEETKHPASRVEVWPLSRIEPYPNNPRTHPPAQVALLAELIKRRGVDQPIVVDEDGVILKGHGRRMAAMLAGLDDFPVVVRRGLSEVEKSAMRIEDNQVALLSGWDRELIREEMTMLKLAGYEMPLLGFGEGQLVAFTTLPGPPGEFGEYGEDIETTWECPRCHYKWSGKPNTGKEDE